MIRIRIWFEWIRFRVFVRKSHVLCAIFFDNVSYSKKNIHRSNEWEKRHKLKSHQTRRHRGIQRAVCFGILPFAIARATRRNLLALSLFLSFSLFHICFSASANNRFCYDDNPLARSRNLIPISRELISGKVYRLINRGKFGRSSWWIFKWIGEFEYDYGGSSRRLSVLGTIRWIFYLFTMGALVAWTNLGIV